MTAHPRKRFFVLHLEERDRPSPQYRYEVQLLGADGRAVGWQYVDDASTALEIGGTRIPLPVIEAARRQLIGRGDFVNEEGNPVPPF